MEKMFCFQCQETAKGTGCTIVGVCGKKPTTAAMMDMLLFATRGVCVVSTVLRNRNSIVDINVNELVADNLFTTITNANFDESALLRKIHKTFVLRNNLLVEANRQGVAVPMVDEITWCEGKYCNLSDAYDDYQLFEKYSEKASQVGVLRNVDVDIRSLKELITYGLKGMAAYIEHARHLGFSDNSLDAFLQSTLSEITINQKTVEELVALALKTGDYCLRAMKLLDTANTSTYGNPKITNVLTGVRHRPGILVSGHDLRDLEMLLQQSFTSEVDVYTHGEMLPAHYYPLLKKYPNLVGNYGGSWWHQRDEFEHFNGPILFTTNCIVPPLDVAKYKNRIYTTNSAGYPGCIHIEADEKGNKDFSAIINLAKQCEPPTEIDNMVLTGGFAHSQFEQLSAVIVEAIKNGAIRKFVVMAGCDGRMPVRDYYTEFAKQLPKDCVILTAGCAKYRYNKLNLGTINGIPRVLDAGQCNDCYSLIKAAITLCNALKIDNVNDLPIVFNIAWYEQKAVAVLLALLSIGIKNIHVGPTLPAFLSPNVRKLLFDMFGLTTITTVSEDMKTLI